MYLFLLSFSPASLNTVYETDIKNCIEELLFMNNHYQLDSNERIAAVFKIQATTDAFSVSL